MSKDEIHPSSDIRESPVEERPLSTAWQPLTPRGVAAFSFTRIGRLLIVQFIVASLVAASVIWFLATTWFPTVREAMSQLPDTGFIENQQLSSLRTTTAPLAENRFLAFVMDANGIGTPALATDLRIEFNRRSFALCSLLGCLVLDYPIDSTIQFNRPELESWWGAWQMVIYWVVGIGAVIWLFATWFALASIYCPFVRLYAFFKDRRLTLVGAWKLSAAALLPPALLAAVAIVLYGLGVIDLVRFLILWALHLVVGWVYLFVSTLRLPRASDARPPVSNPFGDDIHQSPANPFSLEVTDSTPQDPTTTPPPSP